MDGSRRNCVSRYFQPLSQNIQGCLFVLWRKMSISQGYLKTLVTQKLLDCFEIHSRHYQARGKCMPQIMKSKVRYSDSLSCPFESFSNISIPLPILPPKTRLTNAEIWPRLQKVAMSKQIDKVKKKLIEVSL